MDYRNSAENLHATILTSLEKAQINVFERSQNADDPLIRAAIEKEKEFPKNKITFWRNWERDLRVLEAAAEEAATSSYFAKTPCRKKFVKKKKSKNGKEFKSSAPSYSFAPPPKAAELFDQHVIGPANSVKHLLQCAERPSSRAVQVSLSSPASLLCSPPPLGPVRGGSMGRSAAREAPRTSLTQMCTLPSVEELERSRHISLGVIATAPRFVSPALSSSPGPVPLPVPNIAGGCEKFAKAERFGTQHAVSSAVGPGDYNINRLFDTKKDCLSSARADELLRRIEASNAMSSTSAPDLSAAAVFGFGCNLSQHLKYGMCLDGKCGRRGNWEEVMLLSNDETRLTGTKELRHELTQQFTASETTNIIAANNSSSPLHAAVLRGDMDAINILCSLGHDINERNGDGQTIIHRAVLRNFISIIESIFYSYPSLSEAADINAVDNEGDTPLHIAARLGKIELVELLCDAGAEPAAIRNNKGLTPSDVAKTHKIYQLIEVFVTQKKLTEELQSISMSHRRSSGGSVASRRSRRSTRGKSRR